MGTRTSSLAWAPGTLRVLRDEPDACGLVYHMGTKLQAFLNSGRVKDDEKMDYLYMTHEQITIAVKDITSRSPGPTTSVSFLFPTEPAVETRIILAPRHCACGKCGGRKASALDVILCLPEEEEEAAAAAERMGV